MIDYRTVSDNSWKSKGKYVILMVYAMLDSSD